jgi:hypothetical protein
MVMRGAARFEWRISVLGFGHPPRELNSVGRSGNTSHLSRFMR